MSLVRRIANLLRRSKVGQEIDLVHTVAVLIGVPAFVS
jgi:hypothetical protein